MGTSLLNSTTAVESQRYLALGLDGYDGGVVSGTPPVLLLLASALERTIQESGKLFDASARKDSITIFHGSKPASLSIRRYIERIFKYSKCSKSCFVVAYIYMSRFLQRMGAQLTALNVHRLLITSIMVAAKFWDDECYDNAYYARIGGVSTAEMNRMEMKFLFDLEFRLHVTAEVFGKYCLKLVQKERDSGYQINQKIHLWSQQKRRR